MHVLQNKLLIAIDFFFSKKVLNLEIELCLLMAKHHLSLGPVQAQDAHVSVYDAFHYNDA